LITVQYSYILNYFLQRLTCVNKKILKAEMSVAKNSLLKNKETFELPDIISTVNQRFPNCAPRSTFHKFKMYIKTICPITGFGIYQYNIISRYDFMGNKLLQIIVDC